MSILMKILAALKVLGPYLVKLVTLKKAQPIELVTEGARALDLSWTTDARAWAKEWAKVIAEHPGVPYDEGTMITWFSHAIMTGYDAGRTFTREYPASEAAASVPVFEKAKA